MREKIDELRRAMADLDGVIVPAPLADQPQMRCFLESLEKPAVLLSGRPGRRGANRVCIDDFSAAKEMTEYLLSLGHEQIAFVTGGPNYDSAQREQGYRSALENSGKTIDEELICEGAYTFESGLKAGDMLLSMKSKPTAIFAGNDEMALGCIAAASNLGLSVPEDISIAGFDGSPLSVCVTPSLTSVSQPLDRIAELAVQVLNKELNTSDKTEADGFERGPMIVPHKMIIGGSTAKVAPKR